VNAGSSTLRRLSALDQPNDHTTARAIPVVTFEVEVSESQVVQTTAAPAPRRKRATLSDFVTQTFFAEGNRQEAIGIYSETEHVRLRSLDRVPRRWWPMMLAFFLLVAGAAAGAWWLGFRPPAEWQRSKIWQELHLPKMPPPAPRR
jgi:hypothetical protein